jgi:microcystin-dependent protein
MPNLTLINLTPPNLPIGYCPSNYQQLANDIISGSQATFNSTIGNSFFNFGVSTPALNNQVYPWLDENGEWWVFNGGYWNRKNPVPPGTYERRIFIGTTNDLLSYDGGDGTSNAPTNYTGAMWEVDTNFQARFPVGAGTFAASGVVTVGGTTTSTAIAGEDQHTLTVPEIPAHTHNFFPLVTADANNGGANGVQYGTTANVATSSTGGGAAHNNLPPFYGVYFIKRTARIYYTK